MTRIKIKGLIGQDYEVQTSDDMPVSFVHALNGCGKSLFLKAAYYLLSGRYEDAVELPFEKAKVSFGEKTIKFAKRDGYIVATDKDGTELDRPIDIPASVNYYEPDVIYENLEFSNDTDNENNSLFKDIMNETLLNKTVASLKPLRFRFVTGYDLNFRQLSHGEQRIAFLWHRLVFNPKGSLILIDEPERSLDATVMRNLFPKFLELNEKRGWRHQLIVATHSPEIIGSLWKEHNMHHFELHNPAYWSQMKKTKALYKNGASQELQALAEDSDEDDVREKCLEYLEKIGLKSSDAFEFLENLLISDEDLEMKKMSARIIIDKFLKKGEGALRWAIENGDESLLEYIAERLRVVESPVARSLLAIVDNRRLESARS